MTIPTKCCPKCGVEYPATPEYFHRSSATNSGLTSYCKACRSSNRTEWARANRDKVREQERRYRERNPQKYFEKGRSSRERNPLYFRAASAKQRAQLLATDTLLAAEDIAAQIAHQNHLCYWCSQPLGQRYEVDHVVPMSRGGSNSADNIVVACPKCNRTKSNRLPFTEWTPPSPLG